MHSTGLEGDRAYCIDEPGSGKESEYVCWETALVIWKEAAGSERRLMSKYFDHPEHSSGWMKIALGNIEMGVVPQTHKEYVLRQGIDHA